MFLNETKPALDVVLEHHGVKGQKWGVTKATPSGKSSPSAGPKKSKKKKIIVGVVLVAGIAAAAVILHKRGSTPIKTISSTSKTAQAGKHATDTLRKAHMDAFYKDVAQAHAAQTSHMKAVFDKAGQQYNPRKNPFTPEARALLQLKS